MSAAVLSPALPGAHSVFSAQSHLDQYAGIWEWKASTETSQTNASALKITQESVAKISGLSSPLETTRKIKGGESTIGCTPTDTEIVTSSENSKLASSTPPNTQIPQTSQTNNVPSPAQPSEEQSSHPIVQADTTTEAKLKALNDTIVKFQALSLSSRNEYSSRQYLTPNLPNRRVRSYSNPTERNYDAMFMNCSMPLDSMGYCSAPSRASFDFRCSTSVCSQDEKEQCKGEISLNCSTNLEPMGHCPPPSRNLDFRWPGFQLQVSSGTQVGNPTPSKFPIALNADEVVNDQTTAEVGVSESATDSIDSLTLNGGNSPAEAQCTSTSSDFSPTASKIRKILTDGVREEGRVYILKDPSRPSLFKIGMTGDINQRMYDLRSTCKIQHIQEVPNNVGQPCKSYRKIEALVHAELRPFLQKYKCGGCKNRKGDSVEHQEWFAVDEKVALRTVQKWTLFMLRKPFDENGILRDCWSNMLLPENCSKFEAEALGNHTGDWKQRWTDWLDEVEYAEERGSTRDGTINISFDAKI